MRRYILKILVLVIAAVAVPITIKAGDGIVQGQPKYNYVKDETTKTCTLTKLESEAEVDSICIPADFEGYTVTKVAAKAFADIKGIKEVILLGNPEFLEEDVNLFNNPNGITFYYYTGSVAETTFQKNGGKLVPISDVKGLKVKKRVNLQSADISWTAYPNAAEYCVMVKKADGYQKMGTAAGTSFTATQLKAGAKHEFAVYAVIYTVTGKVLNTLSSESASVLLKPAGVKKMKAAAMRSKIRLSWSKVSNINGYQIQRKVHINLKGVKKWSFNHLKTVKGAKKTSLTNVMLVPGMKYSYRIRTYKEVGKKKIYSDWLTIKKKKCR